MTRVLALVPLLLLAGCIPSLRPLYTEDELVFDRALVGRWQAEEGGEVWKFQGSGNNSYTLVHTDDAERSFEFHAHLVQIGEHRFLDLYPERDEMEINDLVKVHLLPTHLFLHVEEIGDELKLRWPSLQWFSQYIHEHPDAIAHKVVPNAGFGDILLTAEPKELQAFFVKHLGTDKAYMPLKPMRRAAKPETRKETPAAK